MRYSYAGAGFTFYPLSYYNFSIYWLFLSVICIGLHSVVDILVDLNPCVPVSNLGNRMIFFYLFIFYVFCVIIITVQICKSNITVSTQFLLLYYSLWCPGLQRLQRFDYIWYTPSSSWRIWLWVSTNVIKVCGYTSMFFRHFTKGNSFADFLFVLFGDETLSKVVYH